MSNLTMIKPPPTPLVVKNSSARFSIFAEASIVTASSSVAAGLQDQLKPGLETELAYMSAIILGRVALAAGVMTWD